MSLLATVSGGQSSFKGLNSLRHTFKKFVGWSAFLSNEESHNACSSAEKETCYILTGSTRVPVWFWISVPMFMQFLLLCDKIFPRWFSRILIGVPSIRSDLTSLLEKSVFCWVYQRIMCAPLDFHMTISKWFHLYPTWSTILNQKFMDLSMILCRAKDIIRI
jgi:hypothetical protein